MSSLTSGRAGRRISAFGLPYGPPFARDVQVFGIPGILFDTNSSGTLKDVALRNHNISNGSGGYCWSGTPVLSNSASSVTITDSSVRNYDSVGTSLTTTSSVTVKTTTVAPVYEASSENFPNCIYANAPTVQVSSNTVSSCTSGVSVTTTGSGTVSNNTIIGFGTFPGSRCRGIRSSIQQSAPP